MGAFDTICLRDEVERFEYQVIKTYLGYADGNIAEAARMLQISRPTLYCKMIRMQQRGLAFDRFRMKYAIRNN